MKSYVRTQVTVTFEFDIEVNVSGYKNVLSSTDLTGTEYDSFITSMISQFDIAGYEVSQNFDYTHSNNRPGSLSEYFTFTRWEDDVQIIVIINVRLSDHTDVSRGKLSSQQKRAKYVSKVGQELAEGKDAEYIATYPVDIVFDDKHFQSFSSTQFYIHSLIKKISQEVEEISKEMS